MNKTLLAASLAIAFTASGTAVAGNLEDELAAIKARLNALEQQVRDQNRVIREKEREIAELKHDERPAGGGWFNRIEVGGVIEVEASHSSTDGSPDEDDLITPTVELGIAAQVNDWVAAELVLLYEEDTNNDDGSGDGAEFDVDTAMITIADPDASWFVNAGQYTLPFGTYDTNLVADPLTLDLGETADTALEAGMAFGPVTASVYVFDGDRFGEAHINNYGAALGLETEVGGVAMTGHIGYLSDLSESDGLLDANANTTSDEIDGWAASVGLGVGAFSFIGEYVAAIDGIANAGNAEPSAYNLEIAYAFEAAGRPATVALAYQGSDEMRAIDPGFSEKRIGGAVSVEIFDGTTVALEYRNDEDYAGVETDTVTGFLAVEF